MAAIFFFKIHISQTWLSQSFTIKLKTYLYTKTYPSALLLRCLGMISELSFCLCALESALEERLSTSTQKNFDHFADKQKTTAFGRSSNHFGS